MADLAGAVQAGLQEARVWQAGFRAGFTVLGAVAEEVVGEDAGEHGFADGHGADADARVVAAFGGEVDFLAHFVNGADGGEDGAGGFDGEAGNNGLAG